MLAFSLLCVRFCACTCVCVRTFAFANGCMRLRGVMCGCESSRVVGVNACVRLCMCKRVCVGFSADVQEFPVVDHYAKKMLIIL